MSIGFIHFAPSQCWLEREHCGDEAVAAKKLLNQVPDTNEYKALRSDISYVHREYVALMDKYSTLDTPETLPRDIRPRNSPEKLPRDTPPRHTPETLPQVFVFPCLQCRHIVGHASYNLNVLWEIVVFLLSPFVSGDIKQREFVQHGVRPCQSVSFFSRRPSVG
jgi:hypothetical protein